jgi:predicted MPP superfamily phosphohydrolase
MIYNFSFTFFSVVIVLLALDFIAWRWMSRLLRRRGVALPWRKFWTAFFLFQIAAIVYHVATRYVDLPLPALLAKFTLSIALLWHVVILPPVLVCLVVNEVVTAAGRIVRRRHPLPVSAGTVSRRQFIGAVGAGLGPAAAVVLTGESLYQLSRFRIRRTTLHLPDLPPALDGLSIAHLTDIHVGRLTEGAILQEMVRATNALDADLVAVTGDLINFNLSDLPRALSVVKQLRARHGVYICEGNHDVMQFALAFEERMEESRLTFLLNDERTIAIAGQRVQLLGLRWGYRGPEGNLQHDPAIFASMRQLMPLRRPEAFQILLAHHPHAFDPAAHAGIPLTLSGHTHGGQLMLTDRIGAGPLMFRYWSGAYRKGKSLLFISNGAGNWFPLRINAPAEIVKITLRRGDPAQDRETIDA